MTDDQCETIDSLQAYLDGLEYAPEGDGSYVFEGVNVDGPVVGYIETNGSITYLT